MDNFEVDHGGGGVGDEGGGGGGLGDEGGGARQCVGKNYADIVSEKASEKQSKSPDLVKIKSLDRNVIITKVKQEVRRLNLPSEKN